MWSGLVRCNDCKTISSRKKRVAATLFHVIFTVGLMLYNATIGFGQLALHSEFAAGYGFNASEFQLDQKNVKGIRSAVFSAEATLSAPLGLRFSAATGMGGRFIASRGNVGSSQYGSRSLKVYVPVLLGYCVGKNTTVMTGLLVRNNKDVNNMHIRSSHNLRFDYVLKVRYIVSPGWALTLNTGYDLGVPRVFLLQDPKLSVQAGLSFCPAGYFKSRNGPIVEP